MGQNLVGFGVAPEPDKTRKRSDFNNKSTDGSEFRKKQNPDNYLKMFENQSEGSYNASLIVKVNKSSIINALKRSYLVPNGLTLRKAFNIEISTVQSCTFSQRMDTGFFVSTFCSLFFTYSMIRI